ncbi:helix-turn-helix transcriptional regulator [Burkholderia gladioli]|nr:metalloregulator ArsR/SmtB family transcription factor [Burkholderia gladioli]MBW5284229.1 helix-turn-helix transcriptional regulator [Burkholderia gladioli]NIF91250.1 helix-turn-helix transcriptional regulator [Burkholderia sp. Cy-637]NRF85539.1 helix-turn-helix transcriptional regulator [Burkholderia gladioli]
MSRASMPAAAQLPGAAPVFAALGDPTRLRIVARLCDAGPLSIALLTQDADISRQAITKHLHALSDAGLVSHQRSGRESVWRLEPQGLAQARRYFDQISEQWDQAIGRLAAFVERDGP